MSESLIFLNLQKNLQKTYKKRTKKYVLVKYFFERITRFLWAKEQMSNSHKKTSDLLICSFIMRDLSESLTVSLLSLVTWAIRSQSLICPEQPERFAHSR